MKLPFLELEVSESCLSEKFQDGVLFEQEIGMEIHWLEINGSNSLSCKITDSYLNSAKILSLGKRAVG